MRSFFCRAAVLHAVLLALPAPRIAAAQTTSADSLLVRFCGTGQRRVDQGALAGRVRDADGGLGLAGVSVVLRWNEIGVDRATAQATSTPHVIAAVSDSQAVFRFCDVPRYTPLFVQAQAADRNSGAIELRLDDEPLLVRGLSLSLRSPGDSGAIGNATIVGEVVNTLGTPVRQARITLDGAMGEAFSNDTGVFVLPRVPSGTGTLVVRSLGFLPKRVAVDLRGGATTAMTVVLDQTVRMLDSVKVLARRYDSREAFIAAFDEKRRASPGGVFLDESYLERRVYAETVDIFRTVSGLTVSPDGVVSLSRGALSMQDSRCVPALYIDNVKMETTLDIVRPQDIRGIEIYKSGATVPPQYMDPCGAIVIWTK